MKKIVVKYSKLSAELKKTVRQKLDEEDVKFFNFPYQGNIEEGFLMEGLTIEGELVNYLVILDAEKKSKYKPSDDDDDDSEDDEFDDEAIEEDLKGVEVDEDEFKNDDVDDDFDDKDDKDDKDDVDDDDIEDVTEEDFDDDEK